MAHVYERPSILALHCLPSVIVGHPQVCFPPKGRSFINISFSAPSRSWLAAAVPVRRPENLNVRLIIQSVGQSVILRMCYRTSTLSYQDFAFDLSFGWISSVCPTINFRLGRLLNMHRFAGEVIWGDFIGRAASLQTGIWNPENILTSVSYENTVQDHQGLARGAKTVIHQDFIPSFLSSTAPPYV